ncbi:MAG: aminotransferase class I/II-fold pyridoxal phosphate-dependent enzyme [Halioglobus sp.]|nr:aminotransferase class I/II-fold pyridoxal phosphate-dependent enzyme [Halioglobus sp.]
MDRSAEFRSDTFTLPDAGMRRAIYEAEVGNAAYGEDPSVSELELTLAEYFGREAALFFPSATMAGQCAIAVWCKPAEVVLIEEYGHNFYFETGSMSFISGTQAQPLPGQNGILAAATLAASIRHIENPHARTGLIVLENTSNYGGGTVYPLATLERIFNLADSHKLPVHIDGARIFNALQHYRLSDPAVRPGALLPATGSLSLCFSKGLGAPMGAALVGDADFISEAARVRTLLGGTLRQAGFMAAAALYGLQHNIDRLNDDHRNARTLAERLAGIEGLAVALDTVQTNMVYVDVQAGAGRAARLIEQLGERGVRAWNLGRRLRFVTSMLVDDTDCDYAAGAVAQAMRAA